MIFSMIAVKLIFLEPNILLAPYVKVYLMKEKKCLAKCRTHQANQTLDPLYQEPFVFRNEFKNCVLQVSGQLNGDI